MDSLETECVAGRCVIYGFAPRDGYDYQTISTVDGRLVEAQVGSFTWSWKFYDTMPEDIATSVYRIRALRNAIEESPEHRRTLQLMLDAAMDDDM